LKRLLELGFEIELDYRQGMYSPIDSPIDSNSPKLVCQHGMNSPRLYNSSSEGYSPIEKLEVEEEASE